MDDLFSKFKQFKRRAKETLIQTIKGKTTTHEEVEFEQQWAAFQEFEKHCTQLQRNLVAYQRLMKDVA